jgi:NitT/TauT family transport system substrate-binding protein
MSPRKQRFTRRQAIVGLATTAAATVGVARVARAADKVRFLTSWYAEAEHGGFYQAKATGLYDRAGLDVEIKMGGPQVNGMQLLTGGDGDLMMGYDIQTLTAVERGLPVVTVGASFQFELTGLMTHPDVKSLADLKRARLLIATSTRTTWWPWLKEKYGLTEEQTGPYTNNLQPFWADKTVAVVAYATSEPYQAELHHEPYNYFLLAKYGYPPYGTTIVTTHGYLQQNPTVVARFVRATMEGWKSYLVNPAPANALIKIDNPKMEDDQLAYSVKTLKLLGAVEGGDAAKMGIGVMTANRWQQTRDFLVQAQLLKASTDWQSAYTLQFVKDMHVMA